ncbi:hypothetical protein [Aureimonas populi]|uniref:Uncharacterized protein n=1 Tax=Aureimonas populi TaxID=1701758 RepID=A0ABW5CN85_9HYPH|nr:hypothetical protein [Aureimonas populi]
MIEQTPIGTADHPSAIRYLVHPDTSTADIQAVLDEAPAGSRVEFAAGAFTLTDHVKVGRSDITVRGQGSGETSFVFAPADGIPDGSAFAVAGPWMEPIGTLAEPVSATSETIRVEGDHGIAPGDVLFLQQANDPAYLDAIGDTAFRLTTDAPQREILVEVAAVTGSDITLKHPVGVAFDAQLAKVQKADLLRNVEIGGFSVEYALGRADPQDFSNTIPTLPHESRLNPSAIYVARVYEAKVEDIALKDVASIGFRFYQLLEAKVSDISADGAHNKGEGGHGYPYLLQEVYRSSFTGLSDVGMRHSLVFSSWDAEAFNDIHIASTDRDINFHGGQDHHNTVTVDSSIASVSWYPALFFNEAGTHYGPPTDMSTNLVFFRYLVSDNKPDVVRAAEGGAVISTGRKSDIVHSGPGDDMLDLGYGDTDRVVFSGERANYEITAAKDSRGEHLVVRDKTGADGTDMIWNVEELEFTDGVVSVDEVTPGGLVPTQAPPLSASLLPPSPEPAAGQAPERASLDAAPPSSALPAPAGGRQDAAGSMALDAAQPVLAGLTGLNWSPGQTTLATLGHPGPLALELFVPDGF